MDSLARIYHGLGLFACTLVIASAGYVIAGWTPLDALYMVVITVFGVGYGEVRAVEGTPLKVFTMCVIVTGAVAYVYTIGGIVQLFTAAELRRTLGARRMTQDISKLRGHAIICGYGRRGHVLTRELAKADRPFVILDNNPERVQELGAAGYLSVLGNAHNEEVLYRAGVEHASVLATCLPDDAANVFITLTARNLNKRMTIIARGEAPSTQCKLQQAGADHVVMPATIGGQKMADMILNPETSGILNRVTAGGSFTGELGQIGLQLARLTVCGDVAGRKLGEVHAFGGSPFIIIAVECTATGRVDRPAPDKRLAAGDAILAIGPHGETPALLLCESQAADSPTAPSPAR